LENTGKALKVINRRCDEEERKCAKNNVNRCVLKYLVNEDVEIDSKKKLAKEDKRIYEG